MKRFTVAISVLLALSLSINVRAATKQAKDITIGVDLSTTGPAAGVGIEFKNAFLLAVPHSIDGHKVRYIMFDDGSDPTHAVQNVKRLISDDNIDVLLGPVGTPISLAVMDTIAAAKVPMFTMGSGNIIVSPMDAKRKWAFKAVPSEDLDNTVMVKHMLKHGVKTLSIIAVNDPFGEGFAQSLKRIATANGIKVLSMERFERTDASTTAQVLHAMEGNPDAIFIVALGTVSVTPQRDLVARGYKGLIYQSGAAATPDFLRVAGKAADGTYLVQVPVLVADQLPQGYPTKKAALHFENVYKSKYGTTSFFGATMWDATHMVDRALAQALTKAQPGTLAFREAVRSALENTKGFVGSQAIYNMLPTDHTGIDELGTCVMRIQNGTWKLDQYTPFK